MSSILNFEKALTQQKESFSFTEDEIHGDALGRDVVVRSLIAPIKKYMQEYEATEIWINNPGELVIQTATGNKVIKEPLLSFDFLESLAKTVAVNSPQQQSVGTKTPILSATLPEGERIQIVLPPALEQGLISISIRIPGSKIIPLQQYQESGAFSRYAWPHPKDFESSIEQLAPEDRLLAQYLYQKDLYNFLVHAIRHKKNIGVIGDTGSGKTMLMKSMCQHIPPNERLITVEDVRELYLPLHHNRAHLLYAKNNQGIANVTPADLIASLMRMSPDRALLAELRGGEAWDFLKLLMTGHSGSITSWHAESCALGAERFVFMVKENDEAATYTRQDIKHLFNITVDVVLHITRQAVYDDAGQQTGFVRFVDEVHFDPWLKHRSRYGDMVL